MLRIKNVPAEQAPARVDDALEKTNLADKRNELIKRLSRGYKQRVGMAQALVHDPDVIILDEPTVGLDPKQIIEVRHLIKGLAGSHTIILSTHILPEVSMTCDRVVIINKGKIAAVDTPQNLTTQLKGGQRIQSGSAGPRRSRWRSLLAQIPGASRVQLEAARSDGHLDRDRRSRAREGHSQPNRREDRREGLAALRTARREPEPGRHFPGTDHRRRGARAAVELNGGHPMRSLYAIYRKEMGHYFVSPVAYVVVGLFLILSGFFFVVRMSTLRERSRSSDAPACGAARVLGVASCSFPASSSRC